MRAAVERLLEEGLSGPDIAKRLGISRSTIAYHKRHAGKPVETKFGLRYDWQEVQRYHDLGHSARACFRHFGFSPATWHEAKRRGDLKTRPAAAPISEIFVAGRKRSRGHLKSRLFAAGLKENRCDDCGITDWRGKPLALELHHVNGDGLDNRLENLQLLCPNCHSQTDTWGGRNSGRKNGLKVAA